MSERSILIENGHQRLVRGRHGYVLYNRNDVVIGRLIELYGEYFESEVDIFRRFLSAGDVAMDIGANIGTHVLAMARLVGARGAVFAFEPQRIVFQTLCANMALNSLDNVYCVNAAVADTAGQLHLGDPDPTVPNNFGGAAVKLLTGADSLPPVAQLVLDEYFSLDQLRLVKIDVEGMEAAVLRGARRTLSRCKPVLYVENGFAERSPELLMLLQELGYQCYWHLPVYVGEGNYFGESARPFPVAFVDRGGSYLDSIGFAVNMLCVHTTLGLSIQGLRLISDPREHPYDRNYMHLFIDGTAGRFPLLRE